MKSVFLIVVCIIVFNSCGLKDDIRKKDTPTSGKLTLMYDEGITLHINNQIYTFTTTYKNSHITLIPSNEKACIEALYNDSCKIIAITRELTTKEMAQFVAKNIYPETSTVAYDAIAFIVNKEFSDSVISINQITNLLKGNDSSFVKSKHISIVFDNQNSGSTRYLKDSLVPNQNFGGNCKAVKNTNELIKAISSNSTSIGVCDYAWLSDKDDNTTKKFLKTIKILSVSRPNNKLAYMPDQSNIATKDYPFTKTICIIRRSSEFSLGKGIETFIAGPIGQLMFLKQGLAPNRQEERLIEVDMSPLK
jgi:phosphate transport system substrate-binding protein